MVNERYPKVSMHQFIRNSLSNYIGKFIGIISWIILTPFILNQLGTTLYGLWVLVGSVVAYGFLLDFGIAGAVTKYTAEYRAKNDSVKAGRMISTALWLYIAFGLSVILSSFLIAPLFPTIFNVSQSDHKTAVQLILISGIGVGVTLPCTITGAVLRGLHRFDIINIISITATILSMGAIVIVLILGGGVLGLVLVGIAITLISQLPSVYFIYKIAPELRFGTLLPNLALLKTVASYSSSIFIMNLGGHLESKTDEIVIGGFLPIGSVTPYSLARKISTLPQLLTEQFLMLLLPIASEINAKEDKKKLRYIYIVSTRVTLGVFLPVGLTIIILAEQIMTLWVGQNYSDYAYLVIILVIASFIDTSQWPAGFILQGISMHHPLATMTIGSGIANVILSIILVNYMGLIGVALGTLIPTSVVSICFVAPYAMRVIGVSISEIVSKIIWPVFIPTVPMSIFLLTLRGLFEPVSIFSLPLVVGIGMLSYFVSYLLMSANDFERRLFLSNITRVIHHLKFHLKKI
jgi:O-antigen/teichoic acid export membrane protein